MKAMKILWRPFILALVLTMLLGSAGAFVAPALADSQPEANPLGVISGTVTDVQTSQPIEGATVSDGTRQTTTAADGSYTVACVPEGSYTVTSSADGYQNASQSVSVTDGSTAAADFALAVLPTRLRGNEPLTVAFSDASGSYDGIISWLWDFGDGTTSTEQNSAHTYNLDGVYTVSLTVTEADGDSYTETKTDYIAVFDTQPNADFSSMPIGTSEPLAVAFTDASTSHDDILSWLWDFGDGQTSTEQNPKHAYAEAGIYTATLTVIDKDGSVSVVSHTVEVVIPSIKVTVTHAGSPLEGHRVYAYTAEGAYAGSKLTDASGQASFTLVEGSYKFRVYYDGGYFWSEVTAVPGSATLDIPAPSVVSVTVAGQPAEDLRVYAYTAEGAYAGQRKTTDASGQASFTLAEGSYKFRVYYDGSYFWSDVITASGSTALDIPAPTVVTVTVGGQPVDDLRVYAYTAEGAYAGQRKTTDASGQASFTLPEGTYKFRGYYDGDYFWSQVVATPGSATIDIPAA